MDSVGSLSLPPHIRELFTSPEVMTKHLSELARDYYEFYVEYTHRGIYKHGKHTRLLSHVLQDVESGKEKRVIITTPPRHSKSMTVTESFPSYFIGKKPNRRVIQVSYGDELARKFGRANKVKIEQFGLDIFNIRLSRDTSAVTNWGIQGYRGGMIATGIGGAITGEGADLLLIDDPIKNREEANSRTYRDKVWNEWQNTLRTRLHPGAAVIIIVTRWHEDDLVGRLLNPEYGDVEDWTLINLPAIAEENDLMEREIGQPLWPEHGFDEKWAKDTEKAVGSAVWASLYQQRPSAAEGAMVKREWWRRYSIPYNRDTNRVGVFVDDMGNYIEYFMDEVIQSWDCSFKDNDGSDMVVGQVWGRSGQNKFLIFQVRSRMGFTETKQAIKMVAMQFPTARLKLIEDKANGPAIINSIQNDGDIGGVVPVNPKGSKLARLSSVTPDIEAGNVFLPTMEIAPWVDAYIDELSSFPRGAHDDQVDATSQALDRLVYSRVSRQPDVPMNTPHDVSRISKHIKSIIQRGKKKKMKDNEYRSYLRR